MTLRLVVDLDGAETVHHQLRTQIMRLVLAGQVGEGDRLPTVRQLAADLGLAKGTIARLYADLEEAGVIETMGRRGSFVAPVETWSAEQRRAQLEASIEALVLEARQSGFERDEVVSMLDAEWDCS